MTRAAAPAERVGDIGESGRAQQDDPLASPDLHILLALFAQTEDMLAQITAQLMAVYSHGATSELPVHEVRSLPEIKAHFGYHDGFAQSTIDGGLPSAMPDVLPKAPAGGFLLGHPSQYADFTYRVPASAALGPNGSFAVFRILTKDCHGFEQFLAEADRQTGIDPELIAAKLCGRWRNGVLLSLFASFRGRTNPSGAAQ